MKSFEERKEEYLNKLKTNPELTSAMIESSQKNGGVEKLAILVDPKTEMDLDLANCTFDFMNDSMVLLEKIFSFEVDEIPLEENEGYNYLINVINLARNKATEQEYREYVAGLTPEQVAIISYDLLVGIATDNESVFEYLAEKVGIDLTDELQMAQLTVRLEEAKKTIPSTDIEHATDKNVDFFKELVRNFHILCTEGKGKKLTQQQ